MMPLTRIWFVVVAGALAAALSVASLGAAKYNRQEAENVAARLAFESESVATALQLDARRRLDALLAVAVDDAVQERLNAASNRVGTVMAPARTSDEALAALAEKIPPDKRPDGLFEVDRDGRVIAFWGAPYISNNGDLEFGGYAAVNDALHGFVRDDTLLLGGKVVRIVARPVEYDTTQSPVGAVVGLRLVDDSFVSDLAHRVGANIAFFAGGERVASAASDDRFAATQFDQAIESLASLNADKQFSEAGRSAVRVIAPSLSALYSRVAGETWEMPVALAVVRASSPIDGPLAFVSAADSVDRSNLNVMSIAALALLVIAIGFALIHLEQARPLKRALGLERSFHDESDALTDDALPPATPTQMQSPAPRASQAQIPMPAPLPQIQMPAPPATPTQMPMAAFAIAPSENEWADVYREFIAAKERCGESIEGLTYERFEATLKRNRDSLVEKHGYKAVRFAAVVKDGKASIRAVPMANQLS